METTKVIADRRSTNEPLTAEEVQDYITAIKRIFAKEVRGTVYVVEHIDESKTQIRLYGNRSPRWDVIRHMLVGIKVRWSEKFKILWL